MAAPADAPVERRVRARLDAAVVNSDVDMWKDDELEELDARQ